MELLIAKLRMLLIYLRRFGHVRLCGLIKVVFCVYHAQVLVHLGFVEVKLWCRDEILLRQVKANSARSEEHLQRFLLEELLEEHLLCHQHPFEVQKSILVQLLWHRWLRLLQRNMRLLVQPSSQIL